MTDEQQAAHERLQARLPVRTVGEPPQPIANELRRRERARNATHRPIIFMGKRYPSIRQAHFATGRSTALIHAYVKKGKANSRYAPS